MKKPYDFLKGVKGKFYVPEDKIHLPVYLDNKNNAYFSRLAKKRKINLSKLINEVLEKDREILNSANVR